MVVRVVVGIKFEQIKNRPISWPIELLRQEYPQSQLSASFFT